MSITGTGSASVIGVATSTTDLYVTGWIPGSGSLDFGGVILPPTNGYTGFVASYTVANELNWVTSIP
jgi:hypothetical protein